jgi:DNA modification methylase
MNLELNKIYEGSALEILRTFPDESIDTCISSPPYWGLRVYGTNPQIWDGAPECKHEWGVTPARRIRTENDVKDKESKQYRNIGANHTLTDTNFCIHCNAWKGELGLEPTFELYLNHLWQIYDEVYRVLKKTGTCWVNLGDSYNNNPSNQSGNLGNAAGLKEIGRIKRQQTNLPAKSLVQIPSRFAIGMTDRGWILRNEIIWYKRSCMPSSARDRFTVDFEKIFFFTKNKNYWFEQQFDKANYDGRKDTEYKGGFKDVSIGKHKRWKNLEEKGQPNHSLHINRSQGDEFYAQKVNEDYVRNKRCFWDLTKEQWLKYCEDIYDNYEMESVWDITTKGFSEAHFATFPQDLVVPMIKAGCPEFICTKCGKAREKVYRAEGLPRTRGKGKNAVMGNQDGRGDINSQKLIEWRENHPVEFTGYTDCNCNAEFKPGIVLDPFMGSGTTAIVARKLGRNFIGIELNPKYIKMAENRLLKELGLFNEAI